MKITRRETTEGVFYTFEEDCNLRDALKIAATMEEIADSIREGAPHTQEQAQEMVEYIQEQPSTTDDTHPSLDMSLIRFAKDGQSATTTKFVGKDTWKLLNAELKRRGFKWISADKDSRWEKT